jgi:hypothetical protein
MNLPTPTGVPQYQCRFFICGVARDQFVFDTGISLNPLEVFLSIPQITRLQRWLLWSQQPYNVQIVSITQNFELEGACNACKLRRLRRRWSIS